jgi:cyclophilin family peptidyl-prolyl cis-trans isomerase
MPNKRTRDRQLAKLAARRQSERQAAKRRRNLTLGALGAVVAVVLAIAGVAILTVDNEQASNSSTPTATASTTSGPKGKPVKTGTVKPQAEPPAKVACGGAAPKGAGEAKPQFSGPPSPNTLKPNVDYVAKVTTSCGSFEMKLDPATAPEAVASFVFLAQDGFFDGLWFHRIVPGFVIQTGDPTGTGGGGPGYQFGYETDPKVTFDHVGLVAMAHSSAPDSNGSQWFVTTGEASHLNGQYTIFGEVVKGYNVVKKIDGVPVGGASGDSPQQAVYVETIKIQERAQEAAPSSSASAGGNSSPTA